MVRVEHFRYCVLVAQSVARRSIAPGYQSSSFPFGNIFAHGISHIAHGYFVPGSTPNCSLHHRAHMEPKNSQRLLSVREKFSLFCSNSTTEQRSKITEKNETHHIFARCLKLTCATLVCLHKDVSSQETTKISMRSSLKPEVTVAI